MKKFLSKSMALLLSSMLLLSTASCGNSNSTDATDATTPQSGGDSGQEVTLEFQQWWGVELPDGFLQEIVDGFTAETGIKVELLSNPYADTRTQVTAGAATNTMADVVGLDGAWVYDFAKQGSIANLSELMSADGYDDSQLSDQVKVDGETYMIPVVNFAYPMYVNMDILERAGVSTVPTNWTEFLDACEKVAALGDNTYGWIIPMSTASPSGVQNCFMSWLWSSGGSMLDENGQPNLVGNEKMIQTTEFVKTMFDKNYVTPGAFAMAEADQVEEFSNGRVAFMTDSLAHLNNIKQSAPDMNIQFMELPVIDGYTGESGIDVASWGIGIAENCENKEAAIKFVEYMMSPEVNAKIAATANAFPGNVNSKPDYSNTDPLFQDAFEIYQKSYAVNEFSGLPTSEELMRQFAEQFELYINGETKTVDEMLSATQSKWEEAFK